MDLPAGLGQRVAVLGGTFDPVHNGHLAIAEAVRAELDCDILFIPAFLPPHKLTYSITDFQDRLAMLQLAVEAQPGFFISDIEALRQGPSYSIDTLRALKPALAEKTELFFIIGMDSFNEFSCWKCFEQFLDYAHLVVVGRPDQCDASVAQVVSRDFGDYAARGTESIWQSKQRPGLIYSVTMEPVDISSTRLRRMQAGGELIATHVPAQVAEYIETRRLYQEQ